MNDILIRYAEKVGGPRPLSTDFPTRVKHQIVEQIASGALEVSVLASGFHMSQRTLQRKLAELGTSVTDLVEAVRRDLAAQYIRESNITVSEIAYLLGYADASAFHHAFKRWFGETPMTYRARARS